MTTQLNVNGLSSGKVGNSSMGVLAASREKMISLLVEARLLQTLSGHSQLIPHLAKDKMYEVSNVRDLSEVFGVKGRLPLDTRRLIGSYIPDEEIGLLALYLNMPRFVDLMNQDVLKGYLEQSVSEHVPSCLEIVKAVYESTPRQISQNKYGSAFPVNPELLAYAMLLARNETVLEIAGATGENSAALAFSGAERVYLNDIGKEEVQVFERIRESLKTTIPKVGKKLESLGGDCFDLLKIKPELTKKVGLVLCRNLIHFFNREKQAEFFALLKKMLKPGARLMFTANSVYVLSEHKKICEASPDATSFATTQGLICDYRRGTKPIARFYYETSVCSDDQVSTDFVARYLYAREVGSKWKVNNEEFSKLDKTLQPKIQEALKPYKPELAAVPAGSVKVLTNRVRMYSTKTFSDLFTRHGFQVESSFVSAFNGHLVNEEDLFGLAGEQGSIIQHPQLVGVIARYPGNE